MKISTYTTWAS